MPLPHLVMPRPMLPRAVEALEKEFIVHKLWESADVASSLAVLRDSVRFVAAGGHAVVDAAMIGALPRLEIIANFGVGYDLIDVAAAASRGIVITNTPDVLNEDVADLAIGLLIATIRELPQAERYLRDGKWLKENYPLTSGTLRGRTLGIVGLGRVGKAIARRAEAFGLEIAYSGRHPQDDVTHRYYPNALSLAEAVDTLMLVVPGGLGTQHMIDAAVLEALGPNGIVINVARGSVIDQAALIEALRAKRILGAGLDVFANEPEVPRELIELDNVVLLPHIGSGSHHTRTAMGQLVRDNLVSWRDGKGPLTPIPETPWPPEAIAEKGSV